MAEVVTTPYGETAAPPNPPGTPVLRYRVTAGDVTVDLIDLGARVVSVTMPDRHGNTGPVCLSLGSLAECEDRRRNPFLGDTIGRYPNRIAGARFVLDGVEYRLDANDGMHHLHGGMGGLGWRVWRGEPFGTDGAAGVVFRYLSPDGEGGYPGELSAESRVTLDDTGTITFDYTATADRPTVVGFTNHTYWNLAGTGTIEDHLLAVRASRYLPVDDDLLPRPGEPAPVDGTPFDLRNERRLGAVLDAVRAARMPGIDHCYLPDAGDGDDRPWAVLRHPARGRRLELWSDQPGMQCFTGHTLTTSGLPMYGGLCLEPQPLPNSPNRPDYPSPVLYPGETYQARIVVRLGIEA